MCPVSKLLKLLCLHKQDDNVGEKAASYAARAEWGSGAKLYMN
jgi:hypothetical protein